MDNKEKQGVVTDILMSVSFYFINSCHNSYYYSCCCWYYTLRVSVNVVMLEKYIVPNNTR